MLNKQTTWTGAQKSDGLYHRDLGLPAALVTPFVGSFFPDYTGHARRASLTDRYGLIELPASVEVEARNVVEVEVRAGVTVKAVVRIPYDNRFDLVLAVCRPCGGFAVVKTVWLNERNDCHKTLRLESYRQLSNLQVA